MFDRFIRLARAKRAIKGGRYDEVLQLVEDPLICDDRRAEQLRIAAQQALVDRGRERLAAGDAVAAVRDLERAMQVGPHVDAETILAAAKRAQQEAVERRLEGRRALGEARQLAEQGQLDAAEGVAGEVGGQSSLGPTAERLRAFVTSRKDQVAQHDRRGREHLRDGRVDEAIEQLAAMRSLDAGASVSWLPGLVEVAAEQFDRESRRLLDEGAPQAAIQQYRRLVGVLPQLAQDKRVIRCGDQVARAACRELAEAKRAESLVELLQACALDPPLPGGGAALMAGAQELQRLTNLRTGGHASELALALGRAAGYLDSDVLRRRAEQVGHRSSAVDLKIAEARALAEAGDLQVARAELLAVLEQSPTHQAARVELDSIDQSLRERQERHDAVKQAAKAGRLREAYAMSLVLAVPGPAGDDARALSKDLCARLDLVQRGLDEIRATLHSRETAGIAGLQHVLGRLDQLAKIQEDQQELPVLRVALQTEITSLEQLEEARVALSRRRLAEVAAVIRQLVAARAELVTPDRLDARVLEFVDQLAKAAEEALAAGRLGELDFCLAGVEAAASLRGDLVELVARLRADSNAQREEADRLMHEASEKLRSRDLAAAEEYCEQARQLWLDAPTPRKFEDKVRLIRDQEVELERVKELAADGDVESAQARMNAMPPTPPMLRTRIFDMKKSLARAQGLESGFLLRVDEGGEFLVLRGETVTLGNLRDGRADLPVLAAIAGRHARIARSMSFHGGMQDSIVAEDGEVHVGGRQVQKHRLQSGDRVQLGRTLRLQYEMRTSRSLTASLQLLGGFQVAGTDRLILLKDRGRDGRILMGPGKDVHIRVPLAQAEVEVYASRSGQICVRCVSGGQIDGQPFRDEHPVTAGAAIEAAGISFVVQPWSRTA